jgi:hypothetical protein
VVIADNVELLEFELRTLSDYNATYPEDVDEISISFSHEEIFLTNVTVELFNQTIFSGNSIYVTFNGPNISLGENETMNFTIKAWKDGYKNASENITFIDKPQLVIQFNPDEGEYVFRDWGEDYFDIRDRDMFGIIVFDEYGNPIEDVKIWFDDETYETKTDVNGSAFLLGPFYEGDTYVRATKNGYYQYEYLVRYHDSEIEANRAFSELSALCLGPFIVIICVIIFIVVLVFLIPTKKQ